MKKTSDQNSTISVEAYADLLGTVRVGGGGVCNSVASSSEASSEFERRGRLPNADFNRITRLLRANTHLDLGFERPRIEEPAKVTSSPSVVAVIILSDLL